ncbi:MAG: tRNA pseudouridine(55) synthase TruB [Buchnera aphidicola (Schlechtendalia peitan)]
MNKYTKINGILLVNKPSGFSSNKILQIVKKILNIEKAGHTGSLDPLATGMLPICCGEATKFAQFLINASKSYRVIAKLGKTTNTSDSEGKVIKVRIVNFMLSRLFEILNSFHGDINQIPSMYSAIKYKGQPLYKYARKGILIPRKSRKITIYKLKYISYDNFCLVLDVICSKGTYIRTLIEDIGEALGCGAHVIQLNRIQVGNYPISKMITLNYLKLLCTYDKNFFLQELHKILIPLDFPVLMFPEINLCIKNSIKIRNGEKIKFFCDLKSPFFRITEGINKNFIGLGKINEYQELLPYRLIVNN